MKPEITITPAPAALTRYTHAAATTDAEDLAERITALESSGLTVTDARSARSSVPNSYRGAYKLHAPFWRFDATTRAVTMADGKLETRTKGASIPPHFTIAGNIPAPEGYRCLSRGETEMDIIPA